MTGRRHPLHRLLLTGLLATLLAGSFLLFGALSAPQASASPAASTPLAASAPLAAALGAVGAPQPAQTAPTPPTPPTAPAAPDGTVTVNVNPTPSTSVSIVLLLTVLAIAPSILLLMTSFTKIFVVLGLTRNALGLNSVPPNQVLAGLSLFLSLFIMSPVLKKVNSEGVQPYLKGTKSQSVAFNDGIAPLRDFMLHHTRSEEIAMMLRAAHLPNPPNPQALDLTTLIPAFVLSELRSAMIIGFVIYIPFLIIDMVVSSSLMSLGMMMLPPVTVSLPFKILLFVLADGWGLIINSLVTSYNTG
jgi:flagellar biosynthesis protein FliP